MTTVFATRVASERLSLLSFLAAFATAALLLAPSLASAQVTLGPNLQTFGVLAGSTVTNTGPTVVTGNVGVSPGLAITGFPPGIATGTQQSSTIPANTAQNELTIAYNTAANPALCNTDLTGIDLGGLTLVPGVYCFTTSAQLTGNLTLDFQGNPNANFLFQVGSTLTTAPGSSVLAINTGGAGCLQNINFQVGISATLDTTTNFAGNILALASITLNGGANLRGRALARNGAVSLDSNLNVGGCPVAAAFPGGPIPLGATGFVAVPTLQEWALIFLGLILAGVGGWHVRRKSSAARY
jgi:Ice-binding-like/IPTL-CTERM motif